MTVRLEGSIKRWIGNSSDTKPALDVNSTEPAAAQIQAGSSFLEVDTGRIYRWDGAAWAVHVPAADTGLALELISQQLVRVQELLAEGLEVDLEPVKAA